MNSFKQNLIPIAFFLVVLGLLSFPVWSHLDQKQDLVVINKKITDVEDKMNIGSGDPLVGGITRTKIGIQTAWVTSLIPSASFNVNLGSATLPVKDIFTTNASVSGTFEMGATSLIKGAGLTSCTGNGNVLRWNSSTFLFSCGTLADDDIPNTITASNYFLKAGDTGSGVWDLGGLTSLEIPNSSGGTLVDAAGELTINTATSSLNLYDGTAERVLRDRTCKTWAYEDPTVANEWGRVYFDDPFTITDISVVTSRSSNAVGWNMTHGISGAITTDVFSSNKSASSSFKYTSFTDGTLTDSEFLMLKITSASAKVENLDVTVCGRYDAP